MLVIQSEKIYVSVGFDNTVHFSIINGFDSFTADVDHFFNRYCCNTLFCVLAYINGSFTYKCNLCCRFICAVSGIYRVLIF